MGVTANSAGAERSKLPVPPALGTKSLGTRNQTQCCSLYYVLSFEEWFKDLQIFGFRHTVRKEKETFVSQVLKSEDQSYSRGLYLLTQSMSRVLDEENSVLKHRVCVSVTAQIASQETPKTSRKLDFSPFRALRP